MKKPSMDTRKIGIILAIILGAFLALYLGGLLGQLLLGYDEWLKQGGFGGNALMTDINMSPFYCIPFVFTASGIKGFLIVTGTAAGITIFAKLHNRFGSKDYDDRNFSVSKSGTYGSASWMKDKDMKQVLETGSPANAEGIILGKKNGSVICLPNDTHLNKHIAVFGATGTMKSRGFIRPYLFQAIKRGESVVVTDPKNELYTDTAELFRKNGYTVKVFNLVNPDNGDSWNAMADMNGDTMIAQILTDVIIANTSGDRGDHFWDNGEGNLLKALVLFVDQEATRESVQKHLPAVYQLLTQNSEKDLSSKFGRLPINHPAKAPYNLFAQASDTVRAGIILGLGTRLQVLQNEAVRRITSSSDIDLAEPGKTKCAYFIIMSDQESSLDFLSSLFFSFLFIKLVRYADSTPDARCKVPVNLVLEEANNIGSIPDLPRRLSTIRSRLVQVVMTVQNLAQLQNRYPDKQWAEILGNMDTQLMMGCTDEVTADFFSIRSGDMTVEVHSTRTVRKTIAIAQMIPEYQAMEGKGRRRLLTPDEVLRLPNDEMLIIIRGQKMLKANKFDFTGHPFAKQLVRSPIYEYVPKRRQPQEIQEKPATPQTETESAKPEAAPPGKKLYGAHKPPDEF